MAGQILLLLLAAFPLMGSPGPATLSLASLGAAFGAGACLRYLLGIILGTTVVLLVVASGVTAAVTTRPALVTAFQVAAGAYILYLAWKIATAPVGSREGAEAERQTVAVPSFPPAFALAVANPKAYAAIGAVYSGHAVMPTDPVLDAGLKIAALTGVIVLVNGAWLLFGAAFSRVLTRPGTGRALNILFAVLLIASVGLAFVG